MLYTYKEASDQKRHKVKNSTVELKDSQLNTARYDLRVRIHSSQPWVHRRRRNLVARI